MYEVYYWVTFLDLVPTDPPALYTNVKIDLTNKTKQAVQTATTITYLADGEKISTTTIYGIVIGACVVFILVTACLCIYLK